ncbi:MAG: DUF2382 domain-containing protein [Cyanobacteria bacterium J06607_15]
MTLSNERPVEADIVDNAAEAKQISLLEEKLQIARRREKVGEVIIRKQVETRVIKVPLRREKLIVERIGKQPEKLTEVVVAEEKVNGFGYDELTDDATLNSTHSKFLSLSETQSLLAAIEQNPAVSGVKIRLEIVSSSNSVQTELEKICDR